MFTVLRRPKKKLFRLSALVVGLLIFALAADRLDAHDFWIVPNAFSIASKGQIELRAQTSSNFPTSQAAVAVERIAGARVIGAGSEERITEMSPVGTSLRLRHAPEADGQYLVAVELVPRSTQTTGAGFKRWLQLEGGASEADRLDLVGAFASIDSSVNFRTTKYGTTLVQVGRKKSPAFTRRAGFPVELVPLSDPANVRVGDTLAVRVVAGANHIHGLAVHAGAASDSSLRTVRTAESINPDLDLKSDANGIVRIPVTKSGWWNVRTLHVAPRAGGEAGQWDIHWTTFVFDVRVRSGNRK